MFCKKGVLRNFAKFTGKHLCQSLFNKVGGWGLQLYYKETLTQVFSCEFCEISKNTFSLRTLPVATCVCSRKIPVGMEASILWWAQYFFLYRYFSDHLIPHYYPLLPLMKSRYHSYFEGYYQKAATVLHPIPWSRYFLFYCEILSTSFFTEHLMTAASVYCCTCFIE